MRIKIMVATLVALAAASLAACSSSDDSAGSGDFNDADVTFAQEMIPHHRQATEMAEMAASRTKNAEVLDLAKRITAAQDPEIETMSGWLKDWGKDVPADDAGMGDMAGMDHSSGGSMQGMMTDAQMSDLEASSGSQFDELFLTMMVEHHEGAVEMAKTEQADGKNTEAVALAKAIETAQTAEISEMNGLLGS